MASRCIWRIYNPSPEIYIYIYIYNISIPWLRGVYGECTTRAQRYQAEAEPRADIEGRGLYICHIHREDMVYIIYSIVNRKIKVQLWWHSAQYSAAAPSSCRFALVFSSATMMAFV